MTYNVDIRVSILAHLLVPFLVKTYSCEKHKSYYLLHMLEMIAALCTHNALEVKYQQV